MVRLPKYSVVFDPGPKSEQSLTPSGVTDGGEKFHRVVRPPYLAASARRTQDKSADEKGLLVGIWDLGASVGYLSEIISAFNNSQKAFKFVEVFAAIPSGMTARFERLKSWYKERTGKAYQRPSKKKIEDLHIEPLDVKSYCILSEEYFRRAAIIRKTQQLSFLVGMSPEPIADQTSENDAEFDLFSQSDDKLILVSTKDLQGYASTLDRPIEAMVAYLILAQLLVEESPKLGFHHENRGCLFDRNDDRKTLIDSFQAMKIESNCEKKIKPELRDSALAMLTVIKSYQRTNKS